MNNTSKFLISTLGCAIMCSNYGYSYSSDDMFYDMDRQFISDKIDKYDNYKYLLDLKGDEFKLELIWELVIGIDMSITPALEAATKKFNKVAGQNAYKLADKIRNEYHRKYNTHVLEYLYDSSVNTKDRVLAIAKEFLNNKTSLYDKKQNVIGDNAINDIEINDNKSADNKIDNDKYWENDELNTSYNEEYNNPLNGVKQNDDNDWLSKSAIYDTTQLNLDDEDLDTV
ncbi:MAG: hypothetical protein IJ848_03025 [Alphaproteobacteria bacterium]|nr:hypothetical protein [Alphaproteobacteria bacterium]